MRWRNSNIDGEHTRDGPQLGKLAIVCSVLKLRRGVEVWICRPAVAERDLLRDIGKKSNLLSNVSDYKEVLEFSNDSWISF